MLTKYTGQNTYIYLNGSTQNSSDVNVAKHSVYPAAELRIGGDNWWKNNANTNNSVNAPAINNYRYPVNLGNGVRCIRESNVAQSSSVAPSYNVDAATGF